MNRPIDRLRDQLAKKSRRSRFAVWLASDNNFAEFEVARREIGIRWDAVADWAVEEGLASSPPGNDEKKGFTAAAAKRAYEREKERRRSSAQEAAATASTAQPGPTVAVVQPPHPSVRILPQPEPEKPAFSQTAEEFLETMKPDWERKPKPVTQAPASASAGGKLAALKESMRKPWEDPPPVPTPAPSAPSDPINDDINAALDAGKWFLTRKRS